MDDFELMELHIDEIISIYETIDSFLKKLDKEIKVLEASIHEE